MPRPRAGDRTPQPWCWQSRTSYGYGCRCDLCTAANTAYQRWRRDVGVVNDQIGPRSDLVPEPPQWNARPACVSSPLDFTAEPPSWRTRKGTPQQRADMDAAWEADRAAVCRSCPVFDACADYAHRIRPSAGFWAGRTWVEGPSHQGMPLEAKRRRRGAA